ncbi:MAG: hypothetical protein ACFFEJ_11160 [Candidatus Thorarchaeota archaeon]
MDQSGTRAQMIFREGVHTLLMFLISLPFYLYGGDVLYGHRLFDEVAEVLLFTSRVGLAVLFVEAAFFWLPYYGLGLMSWRDRWELILLSSIVFGLLSYWVVSPMYFEGEAVYGMAGVWMIALLLLRRLFKAQVRSAK